MPGKAWVISVDMGYGHQRAAAPLADIAYERIITANSDKMISSDERKVWESTRNFYEAISRLKSFPVIGQWLFGMFDISLSISPFFPFRDLSAPTFGVYTLRRSIRKGLCRSLVDYIRGTGLPVIATHPFPVLAAYYAGLGNLYCVVTDTDVSRAWVIDDPKKNTITYFAPCMHVAVRLREYGISEDKIVVTGFPLPKENIGGLSQATLRRDLGNRIPNLDPNHAFTRRNRELLTKRLGASLKSRSDHPLTISYVVGGAGAEAEIGINLIRSFRQRIAEKKARVNLVAGTRMDVLTYYNTQIKSMGMENELGKGINIVFDLNKKEYFEKFWEILHNTDILWTKPSELSFYTALGLPVVIAPPIGAQEHWNQSWLHEMGSGFVQDNPLYACDWLTYWIETGRLAEAAWNGWTKAPVLGTYKIEEYIKSEGAKIESALPAKA